MDIDVIIFSDLGIRILYIKPIHNYLMITKDFPLKDGEYKISSEELLALINKIDETRTEYFKNEIEEKCNKPYYIDELDPEHMPQYILCIHLSRKCNIHCNYCFGHDDYLPNEEVSYEVATAAIDFLVDRMGKNGNMYMIDLSGSGEPLLRFDLVKKVIEYCETKRSQIGKNINVMFSTNGTLLTPEIADYLNSKSNVLLGASLDGPREINDCNRVYANQKGTYDDILKGLSTLNGRGIGLSATITKYSQNVDEIYEHLLPLCNKDSVSIHTVRGYDNSEYSFDQIDLDVLMEHYHKLVFNIKNHLKEGDYAYFTRLLRGSDCFGGYFKQVIYRGGLSKYRCDAGWCRVSLDAKGELYSCSVMMGSEAFHLGNINDGIDKEKQKIFLKSTVESCEKCKKCWAAYVCSGECHATSYMEHGHFFEPNEKTCEFRKRIIKLCIALAEDIKQNNAEAYTAILRFLDGTTNDVNSDSAVWACVTWLKELGIDISYKEIENALDRTSKGAMPNKVYEFLRKHIPDLGSYEIDDPSEVELSEISYPFIAYINLTNDRFYRYALVTGYEEDEIIAHFIETDSKYKIPKEEFFKEVSNIALVRD